jgi:hypothetical protein
MWTVACLTTNDVPHSHLRALRGMWTVACLTTSPDTGIMKSAASHRRKQPGELTQDTAALHHHAGGAAGAAGRPALRKYRRWTLFGHARHGGG